MSKKYCYSFLEVIEGISGNEVKKLNGFPSFWGLFGSEYFNADATESAYWTNGNGKKLFDVIINQHFDDIMLFSDKELSTTTEFIKNCKDFIFRFYSVFRDTREYYDKIISLYVQKENNLLDKLTRESHGGNLFNDTPQNVDIEDFTDDGHGTNATLAHTIEEYDTADTITRIKSIQDNYKKIYNDWAKHFNPLFISGLNYYDVKENED